MIRQQHHLPAPCHLPLTCCSMWVELWPCTTERVWPRWLTIAILPSQAASQYSLEWGKMQARQDIFWWKVSYWCVHCQMSPTLHYNYSCVHMPAFWCSVSCIMNRAVFWGWVCPHIQLTRCHPGLNLKCLVLCVTSNWLANHKYATSMERLPAVSDDIWGGRTLMCICVSYLGAIFVDLHSLQDRGMKTVITHFSSVAQTASGGWICELRGEWSPS